MKKTFTLLVLVMAMTSAIAQTVKIGGTTYNTITEAITAAVDNDVIDITGLHTEAITINKNITLRGTDPITDIIQAAADQASATSRVVYVDGQSGALTVTIENLTFRNGNATDHGGGVFADKVTGLLTLENVTIENNATTKNGGGMSTGGSNVNINNCTIKNNSSTLTGGGLHIVPNNGAAIDAVVNVRNSLITNNESTSKTGGGFIVNGNHQYGDKYTITANFENVTITYNFATVSGGGGQTLGVDHVAGGSESVTIGDTNTSLTMVHCTVAYNTCDDIGKAGLAFANGAATTGPHFNLYNSIVVSDDDVANKALNFAACNPHDIINNMLGGLNAFPSSQDGNNNTKGKTATFAGIATNLTDEGGKVKVLALTDGANSIDYCTTVTGIALPTIDARTYSRDASPDAGAYEYDGVPTSLGKVSALEVSISPNPANDYFRVAGKDEVNRINIYSLGGSLIKSETYVSQVDVSELTKGVYLVQIQGEKGEAIKKLVVK